MSGDRLDKAGEYRRRAQEIRTIAQRISIDEAREQLLETAERFERLAQEEERKAHAAGSKPEDLGYGRYDNEMHICAVRSFQPPQPAEPALVIRRSPMEATDLQIRLAHLAPGETLLLPVAKIEQAFHFYTTPEERRMRGGQVGRVVSMQSHGLWAGREPNSFHSARAAIADEFRIRLQYGTRFEGFGKCSSGLTERRTDYSVKPHRKVAFERAAILKITCSRASPNSRHCRKLEI